MQKMVRITILGGILMLIYLRYNMTFWGLSANTNNVINIIPNFMLVGCYYTIIILCLISIIKSDKKLSLIIYPIALIILTIGAKITISLLSFENYTDLWIVIVNHPIPLEIKQYYLLSELEAIIRYSSPNIYKKPEILEWYRQQISLSLTINNYTDLNLMAPHEIKQYTHNILNLKEHSHAIIFANALVIAAIISLTLVNN